MSSRQDLLESARATLVEAREAARLPQAVLRFHRHVDAILDESHRAHAVEVACRKGCSLCCHMRVEMLPVEAFALAGWLRNHRTAEQLQELRSRLRANVQATRELGVEGRKRSNIACALLGDDGACTAYEARPAQCRKFHSTDLATCEKSYADPHDDNLMSPAHPLVAHNAQVVIAVAQRGLQDAGLDATPLDMNVALSDALDNPRAWRRWRDGKKAFVAALVRALPLLPLVLGAALGIDLDFDFD